MWFRTSLVSLICAAIAAAFWLHLGAPTSLAEASFLASLSSAKHHAWPYIDLVAEMPTGWETVCDSKGYDGPLRLEKYKRTYEPVAPPQVGVWGLIFIRADGSYTKAVGSCRYPRVTPSIGGCRLAADSKLYLVPNQAPSCPRYQPENPASGSAAGP